LSTANKEEEAVEDNVTTNEIIKKWNADEMPRSLGRLTRYIMSNNERMRQKGLIVLHRRFWHFKLQDMMKLLERAGIEIPESEVEKVIKNCSVCRAWRLPPSSPKVKTTLPERFNLIVDFDFMFYHNIPCGVFTDGAIRVSLGHVTVGRTEEDCKQCILAWIGFAQSPPKMIRIDQESSFMTDSMGTWLQRHGIQRVPKGKGSHAHLAEKHIDLVKDTMHHLETEAKENGITLEVRENLTLSIGAKNNSLEFGGFSSIQSLFGTAPDWSHVEVASTPEAKMHCIMYRRMLAQRAFQQAIYEARMKIAARGKGPSISREDMKAGMKVEVFHKVDRAKKEKDVSGWRKECVILDVDDEATVSYKWQGSILKAPSHLVRPEAEQLVLWNSESKYDHQVYIVKDRPFHEHDDVQLLMDYAERIPNNTEQVHGIVIINGEEVLTKEAEENHLELMKIGKSLAVEKLRMAYPSGMVIWSGRKHIPLVNGSGLCTVLMWPRHSRKHCVVQTMNVTSSVTISKIMQNELWTNVCGIMIYSYMNIDLTPNKKVLVLGKMMMKCIVYLIPMMRSKERREL